MDPTCFQASHPASSPPLSPERMAAYVKILREELVPAMGCTEPIAVAYAAAKCRQALGELPQSSLLSVSGNLIKNVKSVIVPNTGGLKGLEASVAAGAVAGDPDAVLEVVSHITPDRYPEIEDYLRTHEIRVELADTDETFYLDLTMRAGEHSARVVISNYHTNIVLLEKDGRALFRSGDAAAQEGGLTDRSVLNVADILTFAEAVPLDQVADILERQVAYNTAIADRGLTEEWGAQVGRTLMSQYDSADLVIRAKAYAAAGSDARMSGCGLPVVIVSGSGNQGMTASLPVVVFARALGKSREELLRALIVADLITIHQKTGIGRLSAFCGAVSAGIGAAAGIAWLYGGRYEAVAHTIVNALAILSGMTCDGAKPSCAAKIAAAVDAGIFGLKLYLNGQQFYAGDGIVTKGVDSTIENVGRMAREGMLETDREILRIMVGD